MTAAEILELLRRRHAGEFFIAEAKTGSSWGRSPGRGERLDGWALRNTWSPLTTCGYEIKCSRADFRGDHKWRDYLPYCHQFYFVAPARLIDKREIPAEAGLLWAHPNRLTAVRAAPRREPVAADLMSIMSYALMSRSRAVRNMHEANAEARDGWRAWLVGEIRDGHIGHLVGAKLRERLDRLYVLEHREVWRDADRQGGTD